MEEEIVEIINELNQLTHPKCNNLYEFILVHSGIKMSKSDITEDEIRKFSNIQLKGLLQELNKKVKDLNKKNNNSEELKLVEQISEIGIQIFSLDKNRNLYETKEQSRAVLSANSIVSFKKKDLEKYQKYMDNNREEKFEKAKVVTKEDLIKFLKQAKKDYTDAELQFVKDKLNELNEQKHL